jgi:hypothetical protein
MVLGANWYLSTRRGRRRGKAKKISSPAHQLRLLFV